ncbi:class I SAM-dependent methyltransferase [Streptomyces sp. TBY4]|uniref:class I SAM-dependent methyltransferase n=1 Tax=Streptomyces sp. TBY4 TaxID=2962030 RepID=UPI0020B676F0|nr:class I SAM-dependent methyltransferase [Streptomyces sp. TBY4]MCP3759129.1 class I SAM-dependent methyltransferase [Streptomyces sp. TBY4]
MEGQLTNFLYRNPQLYDEVYANSHHVDVQLCERAFDRYLGGMPTTLLDVGCGTGEDVAHFAAQGVDAVGVDLQPQMLERAAAKFPGARFVEADIRSLDLGRSFEAIISFGYAIANLHSDLDIAAALHSMAAHAKTSALLLLEALAFQPDTPLSLPSQFTIDTPGLRATAQARYEVDPGSRILHRRRSWRDESGVTTAEDFARFRMLSPEELELLLAAAGFELLELHDREFPDGESLSSSVMVATSRYTGTP